ncbi:MAG TPA: SDR family NAD(P)-dependent oxidoreductase, partial [Polyangiales bacterium]|nr:SDR family NAD(P)-dependent oxidoreductase [Polyangiales bacterium]
LATRLGTHPLTGQTAVIVGASRGLGLVLARQLAHAGCKLALCARDGAELERARRELVSAGAAVFARPLDASRPDQVEDFVNATLRRFGSLDLLITCAATTEVGPLETMSTHDVQEAFEQIFWTAYNPTMAVLPHMRARRNGRIVHVSSFGGRIGVPHLMPYCTAKSALTGFSSSLRAEVAKDGVSVTTVTPGLMRTGSYVYATMRGQRDKEYLWFTAGLNLPFTSLASELAARRILRAAALRQAESTLTLGTRLLVIANAMAPNLMARMLAFQDRLLPSAREGSLVAQTGREVAARSGSALVHAIEAYGRPNAAIHHEYPPDEVLPCAGSSPSLLRAGPSSAN